MKCPSCGAETCPVNGDVPILWLGGYGSQCRIKLKCGHFAILTSVQSYRVSKTRDQKTEDDWGNK